MYGKRTTSTTRATGSCSRRARALSIAVSPISWVHHLVLLVLPLSALVAANRWRLASAWALLLAVSLPSLGTAGLRLGGPDLFWQLVVDAQGLSAVAAVLLLPRLLSRTAAVTVSPAGSGVTAGAPNHRNG